ncbi:MAG: HD domain-containing protein [Victivallales bacterium]|jgi:exopolyphosphatase/guanosine-5'-triphosphate,3'-diphosphate pyrophosphatase|nr:HD domain-containing protein [Victivallales bacterium]
MGKKHVFSYQAGVIDVGAHSTRLDLFEVASGGKITLLESLTRTVNLGYDVFRHGSVSPENLSALGAIMADFSRKLAEYKVRSCRVVATSAIREAFNRELVINRIRSVSNLTLEILESQEESRICFLSMRETLSRVMEFDKLSGLCLVIGTGSLLVSYFADGLMRFSEAIPLGTSRLVDAFGRSSFSIEQILEILRSQDIRQRLRESVGLDPTSPITLLAMGATVRILSGGRYSEGGDDEILELSCEQITSAVNHAIAEEPAALATEYKISEPVAAGVAGCAAILGYFLGAFNCKTFLSPGTTTRIALIRDLVHRRGYGEDKDPFHEDMVAICGAIGRKYGYDPEHAKHVACASLAIYGKLRRNFEFSPRAAVLLEVAAFLHDIGRFVDTRQHNKHSGYLIRNLQLPGLTEAEQKVVAAVARYHRKSPPKESHAEYMQLSAEEKVTVLKLAAVLRVADALDCTRQGRFDGMKLVQRAHTLSIMVPDSGSYRQERLYLELKGGMFNEVFGLDLKIEEIPLTL